ncbi:hypothetical protein NLI96_g12084 [Meripilus lineatus]|uniref:Uncharacterized protein n=1 Tax=Meripilus lineatus TaxID=2056292 RepID=A0AAD5UQR3_9APHY|nr:hypothetical protein NLI96_g12084 [Physisporinus lineatus]
MDPHQTWSASVKHDLPSQLTYQDGLVGAETDDCQWVLTSPNATFIPQPVLDRIRVEVRSDGRFGVEDPIQWPQLFSRMYSHYPLILRRPADPNDDRQPIWFKPSPYDFIPIHGSVVSCLGTLAHEPRERLGVLVEAMSSRISSFVQGQKEPPKYINFCNLSMRAAFSCLTFPSTYRDLVVQVANVQRYWLESNAMLEYMGNHNKRFLLQATGPPLPVDLSFMGTYTADPVAAFKLFAAGIPVWLIRASAAIPSDVCVANLVSLSRPEDVEVKTIGFGQLVYFGHVGEQHHAAVIAANANQPSPSQLAQATTSSSYRASGSKPSSSQKVVKAPSLSQARHSQAPYRRDKRPSRATPAEVAVSQRDKFVEETHPLFPPTIPVWTECLAQVDRQVPTSERMDYFVPEPALLVGPSIRPPKSRYFRNWLKGPADGATHTAKQKAEVLALFKAISSEDQIDTSHNEVEFYGKSFPTDPLETRLCQQVVWEVFEMGFRLELWALDKHICPSSSETPHGEQINEYLRLDLISKIFGGAGHIRLASLPTGDCGLTAMDIRDRIPALEAFRPAFGRICGLVHRAIGYDFIRHEVSTRGQFSISFLTLVMPASKKKKTANATRPRKGGKQAEVPPPTTTPAPAAATSQRRPMVVTEPPLQTRSSVRKQQLVSPAAIADPANGPAANQDAQSDPAAPSLTESGDNGHLDSPVRRRPRPMNAAGGAPDPSKEYEPISAAQQQAVFRAGFPSTTPHCERDGNGPVEANGGASTDKAATTPGTLILPLSPAPNREGGGDESVRASADHADPTPGPPNNPTSPSQTLPAVRSTGNTSECAPKDNAPTSVPLVSTPISEAPTSALVPPPTLNNQSDIPLESSNGGAAAVPTRTGDSSLSEDGPVPGRSEKGKARATDEGGADKEVVDNEDVGEDEEEREEGDILAALLNAAGDDVETHEEEETSPLKKGRLSSKAIADIQAFGQQFRAGSIALANKYQKDVSLIVRVAGMSIQTSRASNAYNDYHSWWSAKHSEDNVGVLLQDQNVKMTEDFKKLMAGVKSKADVKRRMKPIYEEVEIWEKDPTRSVPYATSRMKRAIKQFTELVRHCHLLSTFWGGSNLIAQAITEYDVNLNELLNIIVTILNALKYREQGLDIPLPSVIERVPGPNDENSRDSHRRDFSRRMLEKLKLLATTWKTPPRKFPWAQWLNTAYKRKLRITNWPIWDVPPGDPRGRNAWSPQELSDLMDSKASIEEWTTKERRLSLIDAQNIPLVTDIHGIGICFVSGSSDWAKALAREKQKNESKARRRQKRSALPQKPAPQKRKTPASDSSDDHDDSDSSDSHADTESANEESEKEPASKRRRVHSSSQRHVTSPARGSKKRQPVIDIDDEDDEDEDNDEHAPNTTASGSTSTDPLLTALTAMLRKLPRDQIQALVGGALGQPEAGPSRLPTSRSSKKGSKRSKGTRGTD